MIRSTFDSFPAHNPHRKRWRMLRRAFLATHSHPPTLANHPAQLFVGSVSDRSTVPALLFARSSVSRVAGACVFRVLCVCDERFGTSESYRAENFVTAVRDIFVSRSVLGERRRRLATSLSALPRTFAVESSRETDAVRASGRTDSRMSVCARVCTSSVSSISSTCLPAVSPNKPNHTQTHTHRKRSGTYRKPPPKGRTSVHRNQLADITRPQTHRTSHRRPTHD